MIEKRLTTSPSMSWYPRNFASPSLSMPWEVMYVKRSPPVDNSRKM